MAAPRVTTRVARTSASSLAPSSGRSAYQLSVSASNGSPQTRRKAATVRAQTKTHSLVEAWWEWRLTWPTREPRTGTLGAWRRPRRQLRTQPARCHAQTRRPHRVRARPRSERASVTHLVMSLRSRALGKNLFGRASWRGEAGGGEWAPRRRCRGVAESLEVDTRPGGSSRNACRLCAKINGCRTIGSAPLGTRPL